MIFSKVIDKVQFQDIPEEDLYSETCTVPGAGLSVQDIYKMYARGEMPMPRKAYDEGTALREEYVPTDPHEAMQMSADYVAAQNAAAQAAQQQLAQPAPQEPETAQNSTEA